MKVTGRRRWRKLRQSFHSDRLEKEYVDGIELSILEIIFYR